ncbi:Uu.00g121770.m01.CDS01 [Anthostomella pinea]|uniref:Uu.00g121770.m01.CDS01 n=1 Tax=Anthostomella pinea TaxID=933095 RepID=A0AAI8YEX8_9PEZI|nr:Uu.00g121770.m01.CDS01 [Anthostomella pinea]
MHHGNGNNIPRIRTAVLGLAKATFLGLAAAAPIKTRGHHDNEPEAEGGALWILYVVSMVLVLMGGAFAGLTIALMGQDEIYLQVISLDHEEPQRKNAKRVHDLLNKGKHWVLVTLLLSNVIVNETLPVVLDRCFGGGIAAVVGSTVLIVIFGEVIPQSLCVRYGLQIGGSMSKPVLILMWIMAPVAWPTAKLLDWLLGEDHGTVYKKSGLKTLVTLHKSLGEVDERLNQDEVTIISAVLDLKRKPVGEVMTPMDDVYVMAEDTVLDEKTIDQILDAGYSRIPIHQTGNPTNYVGMLLVKILITYDPEDGKRVRDFPLATLPETRPETSCLDIINFFQEGKSHMVLISDSPGEDQGAIGVVTLEDVIEELIGEEIIDESDVYVDIHKAIRRSHPAPKIRAQRKDLMNKDTAVQDGTLIDLSEGDNVRPGPNQRTASATGSAETPGLSSSPNMAKLLMRRSSAGQDGQMIHTNVPVKANFEDMRDHFKHLGPSNKASNPKATRVSAVKIKPGTSSSPSGQGRTGSVATETTTQDPDADVNERTSLLRPVAKDGIQALHQTYNGPSFTNIDGQPKITLQTDGGSETWEQADRSAQSKSQDSNEDDTSPTDGAETDAIGRIKGYARSGSITENIVEAGGVRKVVLEANSVSDLEDALEDIAEGSTTHSDGDDAAAGSQGNGKKKNRRKKKKGGN